MHENTGLLPLMLLAGLAIGSPAQSQSIAQSKLVGRWVAVEPAEEGASVTKDGHQIHFTGRPAITITLDFKPNNRASLTVKNGKSAKTRLFTYRFINSKLIESHYQNGGKVVRETFTIIRNKLWLASYPISKKPQESIDILYTLTFVKQP